jgi:hypothetical protein
LCTDLAAYNNTQNSCITLRAKKGGGRKKGRKEKKEKKKKDKGKRNRLRFSPLYLQLACMG